MDFFLPYQQRWIDDSSPFKIMEKSRQVGITYADAYDSVIKAASRDNHLDVWVSSRDEGTSRVYLDYCKRWARVLDIIAEDLGMQIIDRTSDLKAGVLLFSTGLRIFALSSHPDAVVGRTGHIKLDEFAVHKQQRDLLRYAQPCTTWGGQLSIISTHRGPFTVFNELIREIKDAGNPKAISHHRVTIEDAVAEGLVERINLISRRSETREQFVSRLRRECIDLEQWQQEYCCIPADEASAFLTWEMLHACVAPGCLRPLSYSLDRTGAQFDTEFYIGVDVGRKEHLTVIDVGEKIGDVMWDRLRIELHNRPFSEIEAELFQFLPLSHVKRICIDGTGIGMQLAERAAQGYSYKVESIHFTSAVKEELAFTLRTAFEDRKLRIDDDPKLKTDLRGVKKLVTSAGNIRFAGDADDSHCDRFWAKALRQHASVTMPVCNAGIMVA